MGSQIKTARNVGVPKPGIESNHAKAIEDAIRRVRNAKELTQEQLADKAGLDPRSVQKIESGSTNVLFTTLVRLKNGLECQWDELLKGF